MILIDLAKCSVVRSIARPAIAEIFVKVEWSRTRKCQSKTFHNGPFIAHYILEAEKSQTEVKTFHNGRFIAHNFLEAERSQTEVNTYHNGPFIARYLLEAEKSQIEVKTFHNLSLYCPQLFGG